MDQGRRAENNATVIVASGGRTQRHESIAVRANERDQLAERRLKNDGD